MSSTVTEGIAYRLGKLFPHTEWSTFSLSRHELQKEVPRMEADASNFGASVLDRGAYIWFLPPDSKYSLIKLKRSRFPFTEFESSIINYCPPVINTFIEARPDSEASRSNLRLAARIAFPDLLIARVMGGLGGQSVWIPGLVLGKLQELANTRYENAICKSGFVFFSDFEKARTTLGARGYRFDEFQEPIRLSESFFDHPASYRYVDGDGSFFLLDSTSSQVLGVLRCHRLQKFSSLERATRLYVKHLLQADGCRSWAAWAGENQDVSVMFSGGELIRSQNRTWRVVEMAHLEEALSNCGIEDKTARLVTTIVFLVSTKRRGTILFFPKHQRTTLNSVASIDRSSLGTQLQEALVGQNISDLIRDGSALDMLTSDGITTIGHDGSILNAGSIVELDRPGESDDSIAGGGRTQAATAASRLGLVIKVSEDGPISLFKSGTELLTLCP